MSLKNELLALSLTEGEEEFVSQLVKELGDIWGRGYHEDILVRTYRLLESRFGRQPRGVRVDTIYMMVEGLIEENMLDNEATPHLFAVFVAAKICRLPLFPFSSFQAGVSA